MTDNPSHLGNYVTADNQAWVCRNRPTFATPAHPGAGAGERRGAVSRKSASEHGIGVREQLRTGQKVVGGGREGVLVGAPVDVVAGELFGAA